MKICIRKEVELSNNIITQEETEICQFDGVGYFVRSYFEYNISTNQMTSRHSAYTIAVSKDEKFTTRQLGVEQSSFLKAVTVIRQKVHSSTGLNKKMDLKSKLREAIG